jgi:hypothetical protein
MLNRMLIVLDVLLLAAAATLGHHLYTVWAASPAATAAADATPAAPLAAASPAAAPAPSTAPPPLTAYAVVAERNLFSPNRSEVTPEPPKPTVPTPTVAAAPPAPKPRLHGVIIGRDGGPRAYLEDPRTRKTFAYTIGDTVAESKVEQIGADRVVLRRGPETFEVLLRDPSKPRPPPLPATPIPGVGAPTMPPGVPAVPPGSPTVPGVAPGAAGEIPATPAPGQAYDPSVQRPTPGAPAPFVPSGPIGRPIIPGRARVPGNIPGAPGVPPRPQPPVNP